MFRRARWPAAFIAAVIVSACLHDYDAFEIADSQAAGAGAMTGAIGGGGHGGEPQGPGGQTQGTAGESTTGGAPNGAAGEPSSSAGSPGACELPEVECGALCTNVTRDPDHCGACDASCSTENVAARACHDGECSPACDVGFADCNQGDLADDGCELPVGADATHCGGCQNDCTQQGNSDGFSCVDSLCGCTSNAECSGGGLGTASCDNDSRLCSCGGVTCVGGEACISSGLNQVCSCNGGSACSPGFTCCQSPAGCKDLASDPENCGACDRRCSTGADCVAGTCQPP
jgi:hypothetical protein